jgi:hypothetical protein
MTNGKLRKGGVTMRMILIASSLMLITLPALAAPKCSRIIGKTVHVSGKVTAALVNNGVASYMVMTAQEGGFPYCNSVLTVVYGERGPLRCQVGQQMTADGSVTGTIEGMGDAQVQSTSYSCR